MKIKEVTDYLSQVSPLSYAEHYDNVGLLVGDAQRELSGIVVSLDSTSDVIEEALDRGCNLVVSFHPIIFDGLKRLVGSSYVEKAVIKAIKHDISIFSMHTALDNVIYGNSGKIAQVLDLKGIEVLINRPLTIRKLVTYVPLDYLQRVRDALFASGAGNIGLYSDCSFSLLGKGQFKPKQGSSPFIGNVGVLEEVEEVQLGVIFQDHMEGSVLKALMESHPYQEVSYELYSLLNSSQDVGMGAIGTLPCKMSQMEFLSYLKDKMQAKCVRFSSGSPSVIEKVAVLGGSGAFAIDRAVLSGADAIVTSDVKYHDFFKGRDRILIADIGHYESEQYTKNLLFDLITKKFPNFAPVFLSKDTNPVNYL